MRTRRHWVAAAVLAGLVGAIPVLLVALPASSTTARAADVTASPMLPPTSGPPSTPSSLPSPTYPFHGTFTPPAATPVMPVPPPVPPFAVDQDAIKNILLLGSDSPDNYLRRTDVIILVSINKQAGTVALWHLPRALFVYIPNHTLDLLNVAYAHGQSRGYPGGGFGLLRDTFRYNFGVELDHYARVNYPGFLAIVEGLGGLSVSVDCAIRDWRLIDPELDPALEESWELFTLIPGRQHLSPHMALWYVRSRQTTSDLDRGRRQMDVLRAMWQQARETGLLAGVADVWPQVSTHVDTDMTLADILELVPLALSVDPARVSRYGGTIGTHYTRTFTADDGREVLVPNRANFLPLIEHLLTPPTANRLRRAAVSVAIADATRYYTGLPQVAADRLAWEGYAVTALEEPAPVRRELSVIYDYTGATKGSALTELQRLLRVGDAQVIAEPDPNRAVDFRVEIGTAYNLCAVGYAEDEIPAAPTPVLDANACQLSFRAEVNVRAGPGTDHAILDLARPGDRMGVVGRSAEGWWQVTRDGAHGWVSGTIATVAATGACDDVPLVRP